jgi:radical SAM superfamily enzyme YgiQ (UPF0313 family)
VKVLIISSNFLPASPSGPAYVAGAALAAGHTVEVFECLFAEHPVGELEDRIARFEPDVVGISIRLVTGDILDESGAFGSRRFDVRPKVREIVDCVKRTSRAQIVLGGPGFNYYGPNWLDYLELDYGIRGEAEFSFPLYLERMENDGDLYSVPGCIYRREGQIHQVPRQLVDDLDATAFPAYELFDLAKYAERGISPAILTKRGCAFRCTFCPYRSLEGARYRLKSPGRVVDEIERIQETHNPKMYTFCDNSFNVPKRHAEAICREIIDRKLGIRWGTGALKPIGITDDFCRLLVDSGCGSVNLAIETASEKMLQSVKRGYHVDDVRGALTCLGHSGIPFGVSLLFGAPGETPETIAETLNLVDSFSTLLDTWVSIGLCLWTDHQRVVEDARREGQLGEDAELFDGAYYISPELPQGYMVELIASLTAKEGYAVQVNKPYAAYTSLWRPTRE